MLTKSTVSEFHGIMFILKDSFSLAAIRIEAYSINAMKMKNSETKAKSDIPLKESVTGKIFCISLSLKVSKIGLIFSITSNLTSESCPILSIKKF